MKRLDGSTLLDTEDIRDINERFDFGFPHEPAYLSALAIPREREEAVHAFLARLLDVPMEDL